MSRFRWKLWAIPAVLVVMGFAIISNGAAASDTSTCQTKTTSTLLSPNGAWAATVQEVYCERGYAFTAAGTYTVVLTSRGSPTEKGSVFSTADDGPASQPAISWLSNKILQISNVGTYYNGLQEKQYSTVTVIYVVNER
jgi:hypothetical protein